MPSILINDKDILYLRKAILTIVPKIGLPKIINASVNNETDDLRIKFNVEKTNEADPNRSTIQIYNLNEQSRALFKADKTRVVLEAGYRNTKAVIFKGDVTKSIDTYERVDIITTVELGDGDNTYRNARFDKGYPAGISTVQIVTEISEAMELPISSVKGLPIFKYANGITLSGVIRKQLDMLMKKDNLEWSIQDETLQILPRDETTNDDIIKINPSSGLIGSPSATDKGVEFISLLQPRLRPGRSVFLDSKFIKGSFKLRTVTHTGDSFSGEFVSKCECTDK